MTLAPDQPITNGGPREAPIPTAIRSTDTLRTVELYPYQQAAPLSNHTLFALGLCVASVWDKEQAQPLTDCDDPSEVLTEWVVDVLRDRLRATLPTTSEETTLGSSYAWVYGEFISLVLNIRDIKNQTAHPASVTGVPENVIDSALLSDWDRDYVRRLRTAAKPDERLLKT